MPDGAYNVTYWWSIAAFDQLILICPNDAAGATDWAIDLSACGVNVQTECPEDAATIISMINADSTGDFVDIDIPFTVDNYATTMPNSGTACLAIVDHLLSLPDHRTRCRDGQEG